MATALDDQEEMAGCGGDSGALETELAGGFARQAVFASCVWLFWLAFIASTLGHAPKKVRVLRFARGRPPLAVHLVIEAVCKFDAWAAQFLPVRCTRLSRGYS